MTSRVYIGVKIVVRPVGYEQKRKNCYMSIILYANTRIVWRVSWFLHASGKTIVYGTVDKEESSGNKTDIAGAGKEKKKKDTKV